MESGRWGEARRRGGCGRGHHVRVLLRSFSVFFVLLTLKQGPNTGHGRPMGLWHSPTRQQASDDWEEGRYNEWE